jgi:hypothetical protein
MLVNGKTAIDAAATFASALAADRAVVAIREIHRLDAALQTRTSARQYSMIPSILVPLLSSLELLRINSHHLD